MRIGRRFHPLALLCVLALTACVGTRAGTRTDSNLLTAEDLDNLGPGITAYEAIERLRPIWLRDRGINSPNAAFADDTLPKVHIDTTPYTIDALRSFRTTDVQTISFMSGPDASTRFGTGYVNGVIVVTTRTGTRPRG